MLKAAPWYPPPTTRRPIYRKRLDLTDRGLAEIDRVVDQVQWLMDNQVPEAISDEFALYRRTLERVRRNVETDLIAAIAQTN